MAATAPVEPAGPPLRSAPSIGGVPSGVRKEGWRSAPLQPCDPELRPPDGPLLRSHGVPDVVLPFAVDLQKSESNSLVPQSELLHHAPTRFVARNDGHLHPVQPQGLERELEDHHDGLGDESRARQLLVDPVPDGAILKWPALNRGEGDLTGKPSLGEDAEAEAAPQLALPLAHPATSTETGAVLGSQRGALRPGLPRDEPRPAARANGQPCLVVALDQCGQPDPPSGQFKGSNHRCSKTRTHRLSNLSGFLGCSGGFPPPGSTAGLGAANERSGDVLMNRPSSANPTIES